MNPTEYDIKSLTYYNHTGILMGKSKTLLTPSEILVKGTKEDILFKYEKSIVKAEDTDKVHVLYRQTGSFSERKKSSSGFDIILQLEARTA